MKSAFTWVAIALPYFVIVLLFLGQHEAIQQGSRCLYIQERLQTAVEEGTETVVFETPGGYVNYRREGI